MQKRWRKFKKNLKADHIVLALLALVGILLGATSIGKIYHLYLLMFPTEGFFAYLFSGGIILATVGVVAVLARIHRVNPFTYYFSWFIIVLTVGVEVFINAIWNASQINTSTSVLDAMTHLTTLETDTCSRVMSCVIAGVIPINAIFYFKVFSEIIIDKFGGKDSIEEPKKRGIGIKGVLKKIWSGEGAVPRCYPQTIDAGKTIESNIVAQVGEMSEDSVREVHVDLAKPDLDHTIVEKSVGTEEAKYLIPEVDPEGDNPFPGDSTGENHVE